MATLRIDLPSHIVEQLQQESSPERSLDSVVGEAIQMWLAARQRGSQDLFLAILRSAGVAATAEQQQAFVAALKATLPSQPMVSREEVERKLAQLTAPLSAEIVAERGEP